MFALVRLQSSRRSLMRRNSLRRRWLFEIAGGIIALLCCLESSLKILPLENGIPWLTPMHRDCRALCWSGFACSALEPLWLRSPLGPGS